MYIFVGNWINEPMSKILYKAVYVSLHTTATEKGLNLSLPLASRFLSLDLAIILEENSEFKPALLF